MTGALLCSLGFVSVELVDEEEGEEEGTLEGSLSPLFMASTELLTLVSRCLGFGNEFSGMKMKMVTHSEAAGMNTIQSQQ